MYLKNILHLFLPFFCLAATAQYSKVSVRAGRLSNTDTLWINAKMKVDSKPGSLMVAAKLEGTNLTDTFFYPLVESENYFEILVPQTYQNGTIDMSFYFYPDMFQISGLLNKNKETKELMVFMLTGNENAFDKIIKVDSLSSSFYLPKLIYENNASIFFNYLEKKGKPDITIRQFPSAADFTDSVGFAQFNFGSSIITGISYDSLKQKRKTPDTTVIAEGKGKMLNEVVVTGSKLYKVNKFKREYVSGRFSNTQGREVDCLTNDDILKYPDCLAYLRSSSGARIDKDENGRDVVFWRNQKIAGFFVDEIETDFYQIKDLDVSSIALIELIPPDLVGPTAFVKGSVLAVYTRKGSYMRPGSFENNWIFSIKGYTPSEYILFSAK